jgi:hypothetical protein
MAQKSPRVDFNDRAARRIGRLERPDREAVAEPVQQPHAGEARLRHLRCADGVIDARCLAAAGRVERRLADAVMDEIGFPPVSRAEIEMRPVRAFEEARCAASSQAAST